AEPVREPPAYGRGLANVRNFSEHYRRSTANCNYRLAEFFYVLNAPDRTQSPFHRSLCHKTTRGVQVCTVRSVHDLVECDISGRHSFWIELNLELPQIPAKYFYSGDPGNCDQ